MNTNVCMLYQGDSPHPAHRTFGDAVNSTYCHFESENGQRYGSILPRIWNGLNISSKYDIIIAEGSAPLQTALVYGLFRNPNATVLYLAADETFFTLKNRATRYIWRILRPIIDHVLDGCISVSKTAYAWCRSYLGDHQNEIVHPPIPSNRYADLRNLPMTPTESIFSILSVGRAEPIKNHQTLVEAVGELRNMVDTELCLTLVGKEHSAREYAAREWVLTPGYVSNDKLVSLYERADVYVHPSIADAYPVSTLEAMLSATPTIVTNHVGTAHRLHSGDVCEPTIRGLSNAIQCRINTNATHIETGQRLRSSVEGLTETSQASAFREAVARLK